MRNVTQCKFINAEHPQVSEAHGYQVTDYLRQKWLANYDDFDSSHPVVFYNNIVIYSVNIHDIYR